MFAWLLGYKTESPDSKVNQSLSSQTSITNAITNLTTQTSLIVAPEEPFFPEPKIDALGAFQKELQQFTDTFKKGIKEWEDLKIKIIFEAGFNSVDLILPGKEKSTTISELFTKIYNGIISLVQSAESNLQDLLGKTFPHIAELCQHIKKDCDEFKKDLPKKEKNKIRIDICDTAICILNELIALLSKIQSELSSCVREAKIAEFLVEQALRMVIQMITTFPVPKFDFSFAEEKYRCYLYYEIKQEKTVLEQLVPTVEGELFLGKYAVETNEKFAETAAQVSQFPCSILFHSNNNVPSPPPELREHAQVNPETLPRPFTKS